MLAALAVVSILVICFGGGYLLNPTNTTKYNYKPEELWEEPEYWKTFEKC